MLKSQIRLPGPVLNRGSLWAGDLNWLLVIPVLLLAAGLAARQLNGAFWVDEVITVQRAGAPGVGGPFSPAQIWADTAQNTYDQVPGYFWLVAGWANLLGWSEYAVRLLSLLAGLLAVAWSYRLGRDLHSPLVGLGAAVALGASAFFINYMHEGRTYAVLALLVAVTIWLYWRVAVGRASRLQQALLVISTAGLLYLHYFAALLIFALCLYHLLFVPKNRQWWQGVVLFGLAGVCFLPWFLTAFDVVQGASDEEWRQAMSLSVIEALDALLNAFSNSSAAFVLFLGGLAVGFRQRGERFLWFLLLGPLGLALIINTWLQMLVAPKYLLFLWVPLALIFGLGLHRLAARRVHPALVLLPWLLVGAWSSLHWQDEPEKYVPWDVLSRQMAGQVQAEDALLYHVYAGAWDGRHERATNYYFRDFPIEPGQLFSWPHDSDEVYLRDLDTLSHGALRVWSAYGSAYRPPRMYVFENALRARGYADCGTAVRHPDVTVTLWARQPETLPLRFGPDADIGIALAQLGPAARAADGRLWLTLGWLLGPAVPPYTYSYSVHVLDASGALAAQADAGFPPGSDFGCALIQMDTGSLSPGTYQLGLVVYAWESGQRLGVTDTDADSLPLGTLTIE